jgi:hypothetical protein
MPVVVADIRTSPSVRMKGMHVLPKWLFCGPGRSTRPVDLASTCAFAAGAALLWWSASIHFHLWDDEGYRHIATIGPLFLLQSIAGVLIAIALVAVRRLWIGVIGIGFGLSTIAGFLITVSHGLFGFKDSWQAPFAHQAFVVELLAVALLAIATALCLIGSAPSGAAGSRAAGLAT